MEAQKRKKTSAKKNGRKAVRHTRKKQGDIIFALDIGTRTVVGILAQKLENGYKILDMETAVHEKRSMTDGQIEDIEAVAQVIKSVKAALEKRSNIKLSKVCIAAAGRALKTMRNKAVCDVSAIRSISAEDLKNAELDAVRETEEKFSEGQERAAFYCVGHSVIGLDLDGYKVQKPEGHRGEKLETEIIACFLPAYVVESLCAAVDIAGLEVSGLTLEPIAAMNIVVPQELRLINIALCDIGAGTSDVAASRDGSVVAYGMATIAGDEVTEELMKKLLVDFNTAEKIKTSEEAEVTYTDILLMEHTITAEKVAELLRPCTENLAETICKEILAANGEAPQVVFLVGGGSKLSGLPALVAKGLGMDETRVIMGRKELMRGITAPARINIGTEHATPLGIAITASEGVKYDFTTITLNGRKVRTLDTNRLTVFELTGLAGIKPEKLMGRSGKTLSFTINGERTILRGTPMTPTEITVNGKPASLNSSVRKGDDVSIIFAQDGEDAVAYLSDYIELDAMYAVAVDFCGEEKIAGRCVLVNGMPVVEDIEIENNSVITTIDITTFGALCEAMEILPEYVLLNGAEADPTKRLRSGDEISTKDRPKPAPSAVPVISEAEEIYIIFNGEPAKFPIIDNTREPIFLDLLAAFSENPTELLAHATTTTINGRVARLGETVHDGDEIIIE
ncbi:MAG: pilus assembly protein PilM [Oscillospiraceae bacterium]|nr:pilus assembly protein PilM [Oscillospiraceae bacterium]